MKFFLIVRAVFLLLSLIVMTPLLSTLLLALHALFDRRRLDDRIIRDLWAAPFLWLCGARVEWRGLEHLQSLRGGLLLFNHSTWIDIFVLFSRLEPLPRFGAKIELFKIPFFGAAMKAVGILPIARDQREKVMKIYEEAALRAKQGEIFALAPEGTRQPTAQIGKFKKGPFLFALRTPMPIIPTVIAGATDIMPKGEWLIAKRKWSYRVIVEFLPPIPTNGFTEDHLSDIQTKTRKAMIDCHQKLLQELRGKEI